MDKNVNTSKKRELGNYLDFVKNNYPKTIWLTKDKYIKNIEFLHSAIYDSLLIFEAFSTHLEKTEKMGHFRFLKDYKEYLTSILVAIPVNHPSFISYLIRTSSESLLKYTYSISYPTKTEDEVAKTPFRYLKDELKQDPVNKDVKKEIVRLLELYGLYSKEIHIHLTNHENYMGTINFYTDTYFLNINKNIQDINLIVKLFILIVGYKINFSITDLSFATHKKLRKNLDQKRWILLSTFHR